jgi:winged helix DNA-binding protein
MTLEIVRHRLNNQLLSQTNLIQPGQVVEWLGAVQSQDYAGAKWALGQRMKGAIDTAIDEAFNQGKILRTHILRPTWHFVTPEDIRWMLALTAPRVHAGNAFMYRQLELNNTIIKKSYTILEKALQGNKNLTRPELASAFEKAGIIAEGQRLGYFMMSAELDRIICSGPRRGRQFTYALLEERAPKVRMLSQDEALAELTQRYFSTRGPATLQDFTWWSGLTMADARKGIEMVKPLFTNEVIDGKTYWYDNSGSPAKEKSPTTHLLPNYDEYFISFKDRSAIGEVIRQSNLDGNNPAFLAHIIIINGQIVGGWRRTLKKDAAIIELNLITKLTKAENQAMMVAIEQYGKFLGLLVEVTNAA